MATKTKKVPDGWILIHRKIQQSKGYFSEPFCKNMAWVDLLLLANHSDNFFYVRGVKVDVKRGQIGYSEDSLAERWRWSRGKVRRYLRGLETGQQIVQQKNHVTTLYTIVNYEEYQSLGTTNDTADGHQTVQQTDINNECIKNDKEYIGRLRRFYKTEIDAHVSHPKIEDYKNMLNYLFGTNETCQPFINVLKMEKQITFNSFLSMEQVSEETGVSSRDILNEMENYKQLRKNNSSIPATAMNWMRRHKKTAA